MNATEPCPRTETLSALTDGELSEEDRVAAQAHADGCPLCAPVLAKFRRLHAGLAALATTDVGVDVVHEVTRRIGPVAPPARSPAPPTSPSTRRRWWPAAVLGPAGAVALSAGVWLGMALTAPVAQQAGALAAQMAPFSAVPAGALCPAPQACGGAR